MTSQVDEITPRLAETPQHGRLTLSQAVLELSGVEATEPDAPQGLILANAWNSEDWPARSRAFLAAVGDVVSRGGASKEGPDEWWDWAKIDRWPASYPKSDPEGTWEPCEITNRGDRECLWLHMVRRIRCRIEERDLADRDAVEATQTDIEAIEAWREACRKRKNAIDQACAELKSAVERRQLTCHGKPLDKDWSLEAPMEKVSEETLRERWFFSPVLGEDGCDTLEVEVEGLGGGIGSAIWQCYSAQEQEFNHYGDVVFDAIEFWQCVNSSKIKYDEKLIDYQWIYIQQEHKNVEAYSSAIFADEGGRISIDRARHYSGRWHPPFTDTDTIEKTAETIQRYVRRFDKEQKNN